MKFLKKINSRGFFILILIIIYGLILRLWKFSEFFYFAIDEEKASFILNGIAKATHFPSVGHPTSIGFRLGPIYYYLFAPAYKMISSSPEIIGYVSVLFSVISSLLLYKLLKKINTLTALIAVFIYNLSYLITIYDRRGWQLSFETPFILLILLSLFKLKEGKSVYFFLVVLSMIFLTQLEVGLFTLIPTLIFVLIVFRIKLKISYIFVSLLLIFLSNSGLLVFDLRHNFLNAKYLINYFNKDETIRIQNNTPLTKSRNIYLAHNLIPGTLSRILIPSGKADLAIQYANCPQYLNYKYSNNSIFSLLLTAAIIIYSFFFIYKFQNKKSIENSLLYFCAFAFIIHFSAIALYTYFFHGEMAEYYLIPIFIFFIISTASLTGLIYKKFSKILIVILLLLFAYINSKILFTSTNSYGLENKKKAIEFALEETENRSFVLNSFQTCWYSGGFRYLFSLARREPLTSYMDQYLSEYYSPNTKLTPSYSVTIITPELIGKQPEGFDQFYFNTSNKSFAKAIFGSVEVFISR